MPSAASLGARSIPRLADAESVAPLAAGCRRTERGVRARRPGVDAPPLCDLLALRRRSPALRRGSLHLRDAPDEVLAYERAWDGDRRLVLVNFGDREAEVPLEGSWAVDVASRPQPAPGVVPAHGAAVLAPER